MHKKNKIFLGFVEIASQIEIYKKSFEMLGYEVMSVLDRRPTLNSGERGSYSFVIKDVLDDIFSNVSEKQRDVFLHSYSDFIKTSLFRKAVKECDIFFFTYNSSFFPDKRDFALLKKAGKKIVVNFCGTDIRWKPAMNQEFDKHNMYSIPYDGFYDENVSVLRQLDALRVAEKYADIILSLPNQSQLAIRPYHNFFYPICLDEIEENSTQRKDKPVVAHAPSVRNIKGTKYVLDVFERLQQDGVIFEPLLIENMSYSEALEAYKKTDLLVGQMFCPGGGKQSFELLAGGKVVLTCMGYDAGYPQFEKKEECPIIDVNKDNLYDVLKDTIENYELRQSLAKKGRAYVDKYHNAYKLCENIINELNADTPVCHHYPTFFRDEFIPESEEVVWIYNRYNENLKNCSWYKDYVKPGERVGMIF